MDWFVEEVANCEPDNVARGRTPEEKVHPRRTQRCAMKIVHRCRKLFHGNSLVGDDKPELRFLCASPISSGWKEAWEAAPPCAIECNRAELPSRNEHQRGKGTGFCFRGHWFVFFAFRRA